MGLKTYIKMPDGSIAINPMKRYIRDYWLTSDPETVTLAAAGAPGDSVAGVRFPIDTQGHFEITSIMFQATSPNFVVRIQDPGTRRFWHPQDREIHAATIAGTAQRQFLLPETYFLNVEDAERSLIVDFRNLDSNANTVRWVFFGRRWYHKESTPNVQMKMREYFAKKERTNVYFLTPQDLISLGASASASFDIRASDEADTEIFKLSAFSTGSFTTRIRELANNRTLSNNVIHNLDMWGTADFPFILQETLLLERNYIMKAELTDLSGALNNIFLTLAGRRIYYA